MKLTKLSEQHYPDGVVPHPTWDFQDSSKIKVYQKCPRKYFYEYILGLRKGDNHDLVFGHAVHLAMEALYLLYKANDSKYDKSMVPQCYEVFLNDYRQTFDELTDMDKFPKNPAEVEKMLYEYIEHYSYDDFEVAGQESYFKFALGEGMVLVGKLDLPVINKRGQLEILEHKTTKWNDYRWAEQWSNSIQVNNYALAGYVIHPDFKQIKVNGLKFFKTANAKNPRFERVPINKGINGIEDALSTVQAWMTKINQDFALLSESSAESNSMRCFARNGESCMDFGRTCMFKTFCENSHNPLKEIDMLQRNFDVQWWDPLEEAGEGNVVESDLGRK